MKFRSQKIKHALLIHLQFLIQYSLKSIFLIRIHHVNEEAKTMIFVKEMLHLAAVIAKSILTKFRKDEQDVTRNSAQDMDETSSLYDTVHRRRYRSNRTSAGIQPRPKSAKIVIIFFLLTIFCGLQIIIILYFKIEHVGTE